MHILLKWQHRAVVKKKTMKNKRPLLPAWCMSKYLRTDRLAGEMQNMLQLVLRELLSILKSPSLKVPTALIKVVQLEKLCNIPPAGGRQGTTITLHSGVCFCSTSATLGDETELGSLLPKSQDDIVRRRQWFLKFEVFKPELCVNHD